MREFSYLVVFADYGMPGRASACIHKATTRKQNGSDQRHLERNAGRGGLTNERNECLMLSPFK